MNRRRMMTEGKVEPLVVFKRGDSNLTNGTIISGKAIFDSGEIVVRPTPHSAAGSSWYSPNGIDIGGINFSRYKKLNIKCKANIADYESGKDVHFAGFGENIGYRKEDYSAFQYAPKYAGVIAFDISKVKGEKYIKVSANHAGTASISIYDIWLE